MGLKTARIIMIVADQKDRESNFYLIIRPNCSLTWRGTLTYFAGISLVALTIALMFSLKGAWMILPFAGIEIMVLAICLYITACKSTEREVISINDEVIRIERGRYQPRDTMELTRVWAQVELHRNQPGWYPSRLTIRSCGKEVEVGAHLGEEEREQLARELRSRLKTQELKNSFVL
jgi:uncharacterized membrane protein